MTVIEVEGVGPISVDLAASIKPITRTVSMIGLKITPNFEIDELPIHVVVEDRETIGEKFVHSQPFLLKKRYVGETTTLNFPVAMPDPLPKEFIIEIHSALSFTGTAPRIAVEVPLTHLFLPEEEYDPRLLDAQSLLPVTSLRNASYEALYEKKFKHFNKIQTQVFQALYNSDDNVFLAAPPGSGKTICAEFAILRNHQKGPMRVVYVAPIKALAQKRYHDWKRKFGGGLNLMIVKLTGETATDLKLLEEGQIIITTPQIWDALSRQWKQIIDIQNVSLFIIDNLHFIGGGQEGSALEMITIRMKNQISTKLGKKIRIVALSDPVLNGKDIGEWIGATSHSLFNFHRTARPVPLQVFIENVGKEGSHYFPQITKNVEPILVYVPTMDNIKHACALLISYLHEGPWKINEQQQKAFEAAVCEISDFELKATVTSGVVFMHEGLNNDDCEVVIRLFEAGLIKFCVLSSSMCWAVSLLAPLVVLMDTDLYDSRGPNFSIADIFHMMGQAGRQSIDSVGKVLILCCQGKKRHYDIFLGELLPIESNLHHCLLDTLNAGVVDGIIRNTRDGVDFLAETFLCQRLHKNPGYYDLYGVSDEEVGNHLFSLFERSMNELITSGMVLHDGGGALSPSNLGYIASDYYIKCKTVEVFSKLTRESDIEEILQNLLSAVEYDELPIRRIYDEEEEIHKLITKQKFPHSSKRVTNPHVKASALLQAHFSRLPITSVNLAADKSEVILLFDKLIIGLMKLISERQWLLLFNRAMVIIPMLFQAVWHDAPILLQVPHLTTDLVAKCHEKHIQNFNDLKTMGMDSASKLLGLTTSQWSDITRFMEYSRFPMNLRVREDTIVIEQRRTIDVVLSTKRKRSERLICSPYYPSERREKWWVFLSDALDQVISFQLLYPWTTNTLDATLRFTAPVQAESAAYELLFISESIKGVTQTRRFVVKGCV